MSISNEIIRVIDDLCEKLGIAIDWTADNILPILKSLCEKYITFEIRTSIFWIALMTAISLICWAITCPLCHKAKKHNWDSYEDICTIAIVGLVISAIISFIAIIVIGIQVYDIIEAITFPEKTIYDYIKYQISLHS